MTTPADQYVHVAIPIKGWWTVVRTLTNPAQNEIKAAVTAIEQDNPNATERIVVTTALDDPLLVEASLNVSEEHEQRQLSNGA